MSDGMALLTLGELDDPEAIHPQLERLDATSYRMALFVPMDELQAKPEKVLRFLWGQLGELLVEHKDRRGVFVFPEGRYEAEDYEGLVAEVAESGFWARPPEPELPEEDETPVEERGGALQQLAQEALAAIMKTQGAAAAAPSAGAAPQAESQDPGDAPASGASAEMLDVADRYDVLAAELERAAGHLRATADNFRKRDVLRASAHRHAADGHLIRAKLELDTLAVMHAGKARLPDE